MWLSLSIKVDSEHESGKALRQGVEFCKNIEVYRGWAPPKDCEGGGSSPPVSGPDPLLAHALPTPPTMGGPLVSHHEKKKKKHNLAKMQPYWGDPTA